MAEHFPLLKSSINVAQRVSPFSGLSSPALTVDGPEEGSGRFFGLAWHGHYQYQRQGASWARVSRMSIKHISIYVISILDVKHVLHMSLYTPQEMSRVPQCSLVGWRTFALRRITVGVLREIAWQNLEWIHSCFAHAALCDPKACTSMHIARCYVLTATDVFHILFVLNSHCTIMMTILAMQQIGSYSQHADSPEVL